MSGRRGNANRIRGPQSALTDFLAANNISAAQIRDDYERRRATALNAAAAAAAAEGLAGTESESALEAAAEDESVAEASSASKKRKRASEKSKTTSKKSKAKKAKKEDSDDDFSVDDGDILPSMYKKSKRLPGQLENCEACDQRFTVTNYSKTGPEGGLLCAPCGKLLKPEEKRSATAKKSAHGPKRRMLESARLDGNVKHGPKSLQQLCIQKVADHHLDIEEFGDLPETVLDRLSEIFSKRRVIDSRTLALFLRPDLDKVAIHDCANLGIDDYKQIFAIVPKVQKIVLRHASQFKDSVLSYMIEKAHNVSYFQLYGANLITDPMWQIFFETYGHKLETLKLQWLDAAFDDSHVDALVTHCPNLRRLKLKYCRRLTSQSLLFLAKLKHLEHLSLQFSFPVDTNELVPLITALGSNLQTLSLESCPEADESVVHAIRKNCQKLRKLRLANNYYIRDHDFQQLFTGATENGNHSEIWANPPLLFADFSSTRDMDNTNSAGPEDFPIGLASNAFKALMSHSGSQIEHLNIASCRHISHAAFCDVFNSAARYPALKEINISFCNAVDSAVVAGIFQRCPKMKKLVAFGCFNIENVQVPKDVALIGVPKAHEAIEQYGDVDIDAMEIVNSMVRVEA